MLKGYFSQEGSYWETKGTTSAWKNNNITSYGKHPTSRGQVIRSRGGVAGGGIKWF
jgi:hypothetical protein